MKTPGAKTLLFLIILLMILTTPLSCQSAEKKPFIRFAFQDRIGSAVSILAYRKGYFAEEGLDVKPLRFSSGPAIAEALFAGAADIGDMGDTAAIIITARSEKFLIIASQATGEHRHRIMVRKDSDMLSLTNLKGKRIAVRKGTSTFGGLLAALKKEDISPKELEIIDLTPPLMVDALMAGSLDAFAASEPTPSAAEQKGARELITLGGLGNEYPLLILANKDMLMRAPEASKSFVRAMKKAEVYIAEHPGEATEILASETGLPLTVTQMAMKRHQFRLRLDAEIISSLEQTANFLLDHNIIPELPDFAAITKRDLFE